jgi:hypothetical protein
MKYCRTTTEAHTIAQTYPLCVEAIDAHIVGEGYYGILPLFTNGETLIDLDLAEKLMAAIELRAPNQSMDMSIGLKNHNATIREMLLVDFKFRVVNPNNLVQVDMTGKVAGSLLILGTSTTVRSEYIFIFQPNLVQQARNRLARMIPRIHSGFIAMDINDLKAAYF